MVTHRVTTDDSFYEVSRKRSSEEIKFEQRPDTENMLVRSDIIYD